MKTGAASDCETTERTDGRDRRTLLLVAFAFWLALSLLATLWHRPYEWDSVCRYAPMAEAFARGDWEQAFHPRFGVLWSALAGSLVWLTGMGGLVACQIVAVGFLSFSILPLWTLARGFFDRRIAWWTAILWLAADSNVRYAVDGLRESVKCLAFPLLALAVIRRRSSLFSAAMALLALAFSYGYCLAVVFTGLWCAFFLWKRDFRRVIAPLATLLFATAALGLMMHSQTGVFVPVVNLIPILRAKGLVP